MKEGFSLNLKFLTLGILLEIVFRYFFKGLLRIIYVSLFLFFFQIYLHQLISLTSNKMTVNLEFIWVNLVSFFTEEYVPSLEEQPGQGRRNRGFRGPFPLSRFCLKKKQNDLFQKALNYQREIQRRDHNDSKISLQSFHIQKQDINQKHPDLSKWPVRNSKLPSYKSQNYLISRWKSRFEG